MRRPSSCGQAEGAGRPRVDLDQGAVDDAPPVEGGVPLGVLVQGAPGRGSTPRSAAAAARRARPPTGRPRPASPTRWPRSRRPRDPGAARRAPGGRPSTFSPRSTARTSVLGRVAQADVGEAERVVRHLGPPAGEDDLAGRHDLVPGQRGQGVQRGRDVGGGHARLDVTRRRARSPSTIRPMDDAADRAARSARELARRHRGRPPRRAGGARQRPLGRRPSSSGARRTRSRSTPCPSSRTYTAAGHRAHGWSVPSWRGAGSWSSAGAAISTRVSTPAEVVHPLRTGHRRRLLHRDPHRGRGRHPRRPRPGARHGGRGPPQPDRTQPAAAGPTFVDMVDAYSPALRATALATPDPAAAAALAAAARRLRPAGGPPVRDAGRDPHAADDRRRRRRHVDGARDDRRPRRPAPTSSAWRW